MTRPLRSRTGLAPALLLACLPLAGCVVIDSDSHTETSGTQISPTTLAQVEPGKSADFVLALLGEPSSRTTLADGTEIWKWTYRETRRSGGHILFVIDSDSTRETTLTSYVELCNGLVVKAWQD